MRMQLSTRHLREGIHEQGVHIPGLMLLCRTLANHFAPLESEMQTRAMAESMNFARMGHETIDVSLTRFEVLRHRAAQRGGLMMNTTTLSYLLLSGLRLRPEQRERALMPLDGQLPHDDAAFQQLFDRLRRIGRMHEGHFNPPSKQGATGDVGYHFFPTFDQPFPMPVLVSEWIIQHTMVVTGITPVMIAVMIRVHSCLKCLRPVVLIDPKHLHRFR